MRTRLERLRTYGIAGVGGIFATIGVAMTLFPHVARDRTWGATTAVLFGTAAWVAVMKDRRGRGLPAQPSPTLRVGDGPARPDRLAFGPGRERIAYLIAATLFFGATAVTGFGGIGGLRGSVVGWISVSFVLASLFAIASSFGPRIVFERDRLLYRWLLRAWLDVPYAELASGDVVATAAGEFCTLQLRDPDAFFASQTVRARREMAGCIRYYGAPIVLPNDVAPNAGQLLSLVEQYATWNGAAHARGVLE